MIFKAPSLIRKSAIYIWFVSTKRKMILQGFWSFWYHLLCNTLGNALQCQQKKYSSVEAKTNNMKKYHPLKILSFRSFRYAVSNIHNSYLTVSTLSMNKSLISVSLSLELHVVSTFCSEYDTSFTFSLYFTQ